MRSKSYVAEKASVPQTKNIKDAESWFEVLQTGSKSQTAAMTLLPGQASGDRIESHEDSEQVLIVLQGEVFAEIGGNEETLKRGDVVVIPAGVKHRFTNKSKIVALTFNVYSPPEYPEDERG